MRKSFWSFAISLLVAGLVFVSCADFGGNKSGSVLVSFGTGVIKAVSSHARDVIEDVSEEDISDYYEDSDDFWSDSNIKSMSARIDFSLSGASKKSKSIDITSYIEAAEASDDDDFPEVSETVTFDGLPVGSKVTVNADIYVTLTFTQEFLTEIRAQWEYMQQYAQYIPASERAYFEYIKQIAETGSIVEHMMTGTSDEVTITSGDNRTAVYLKFVEEDEPEEEGIPYTATLTLDSGDYEISDDVTVEEVAIYAFSQGDALAAANVLSLMQKGSENSDGSVFTELSKGIYVGGFYDDDVSASGTTLTVSGATSGLEAGSSYYFFGRVYLSDGTLCLAHPNVSLTDASVAVTALTAISADSNSISLGYMPWSYGAILPSEEMVDVTIKFYLQTKAGTDTTEPENYTLNSELTQVLQIPQSSLSAFLAYTVPQLAESSLPGYTYQFYKVTDTTPPEVLLYFALAVSADGTVVANNGTLNISIIG